jgi:hypothetical protein
VDAKAFLRWRTMAPKFITTYVVIAQAQVFENDPDDWQSTPGMVANPDHHSPNSPTAEDCKDLDEVSDDDVGLVSEEDDEDNTSESTNDPDVNDGDDDND